MRHRVPVKNLPGVGEKWFLVSDRPADRPTGLPLEEAISVVQAAIGRLWSPAGSVALAYLRRRGLEEETIRSARLGWSPELFVPRRDGSGTYRVHGITIPWFDGDRLTMVKVRQPDGSQPKYVQLFADRPLIYPGPGVIRTGKPLVIVEGEFDALLVGQDLEGTAAVVTLGSASARPVPDVLLPMLAASPWYIATDADLAGDRSAEGWPAGRTRRVRPPSPYKDWTEFHLAGFNHIRYCWGGILPHPERDWDEIMTRRWATDDAASDGTPFDSLVA
jgi:hypothetical protein